MPSIFQGKCRHCSHTTPLHSDVAIAILLERDHAAACMPSNSDYLLDDVGELGAAGESHSSCCRIPAKT